MNFSALSLPRTLDRGRWRHFLTLALAFVAGTSILSVLMITGEVRMAVAFTIGTVLVVLAMMDLRLAILAVLAYLVVMGDLRRLLIPVAGWSGSDPLLLIGPVFVILVVGYLMAARLTRFDTTLAPWIVGLMLIMLIQTVNPRQGGLMVGVAGALFYIVPVLWFWIGQTFFTLHLYRLLIFKFVLPVSLISSVFGLFQTFYGYLPHQQMWYDCCSYTALGVEGIQAPISFFASSIEYSAFNVVGAIVLWALYLKTGNRVALAGILPLLTASFLMGSRGPVLVFTVTAAALWAALGHDRRTWVLRGALAVFVGSVALGLSVSGISQNISTDNQRVQHRIQRQAHGLLNPGESTAVVHSMMFLHGIKSGFTTPLGSGLGSTTRAASKFGEGSRGSEKDISNLFISTGLIGGILYLIIVFKITQLSIQYWHTDRSVVALCIAGVLGITLFGWLAGGRYALTPLIWITIGALDRNASTPN